MEGEKSKTPSLEEKALQQRKVKTAHAKKKFLVNDNILVGLAVSGGGPRAMCSTVGGMDGLAATGLLDCVDLMTVLSGSSWAVSRWLTNKGDTHAFHGTPDDPWKFGGKLDPTRHQHGEFSFGEKALNGLVGAVKPDVAALVHRFKWKALAALTLPAVRVDVLSEWAEFLEEDVVLKGIEYHKFCNIQTKLSSGDYPIPICTAITRDKDDDSWQMVEFTPWQVRESREPGKRFFDLEQLETKDLIAIWGSAFAVDSIHKDGQKILKHPLGRWLVADDAVTDKHKALAEHSFGQHLAKNVTHQTEDGYEFRDAGIDVNVPFTPLVRHKVDIIIVLDASGEARGPAELSNAVDRGYIRVREEDKHLLKKDFASNEIVRVFWPAGKGQPAIVYIMAATIESTFNFAYTNNKWVGIADCVKRRVVGAQEHILRVMQLVSKWKNNLGRGIIDIGTSLSAHAKLETFYKRLYQRMPLFSNEKKDFESLFHSVELLKEDEGVDGHLLPAGTCELENIWSNAAAPRIVLQGDGGTGKTIFTMKMARLQYWGSMFAGVVLVPLQNLAAKLDDRELSKERLLELVFESDVDDLDDCDNVDQLVAWDES